jgi:FkbM family methyltransferase
MGLCHSRDLSAVSGNLMSSQARRELLFRDIDVIIDGGANCGQYGLWARQCGFRGRIISFEAASEAFGELSDTAKRDGNWECHNVALGPEDGEILLHLSRSSLGSSVFRPTDYHMRTWPDDIETGAERVPMRSLGSMWHELGCVGRRIYLKLDVEGFELSVLKGVGPSLDCIAMLELELPMVSMYCDAPTFQEILGFLVGRGFSIVALEQNHRGDESTGQMLMVDGIFRSSIGPQSATADHQARSMTIERQKESDR